MSEKEEIQLKIVRKIVEQGNCRGILCKECPIYISPTKQCRDNAVSLAKAYIKEHSISKKDLLKRVEKLEEKVEVIDVVKKIIRQGNCVGIACRADINQSLPVCPLLGDGCDGWTHRAVDAAKAYIYKHSQIKDLLKRIEKLEKNVVGLENRVSPIVDLGANNVTAARYSLENNIAKLVKEYKDKTDSDVVVDLIYL